MRITITLNGSGGELARQTVTTTEDEQSAAIHAVIAGWCLAAGDTIIIENAQ